MDRISHSDITGLVLAGGRGTRMGGADKGLQLFQGIPLALHCLRRLQSQTGAVALNANRHLEAYAAFGLPVWPDATDSFDGPLSGFMAGLEHCDTPYLVTVPCDTPLFPHDLVMRLAAALVGADADLAMVLAPELDPATGQTMLRPQPVCCLLHRRLLHSLHTYTQAGGRRVGVWAHAQRMVSVSFDAPGDDPRAFCNANTLAELRALESPSP